MNREIIYRGKRTDNGEWVYGTSPLEGFGLNRDKNKFTTMYNVDDRGGLNCYIIDPSTVGQYTGLKDKNGVNIFEGDICRDSLGLTFIVEWDSNNARFIGYTTDTWDSNAGKYVQGERRIGYVSKYPKVEVIGNIHYKEGNDG